MEPTDGNETTISNGQVIALGAAVAGLVSLLLVLLGRRQQTTPQQDAAQHAAAAATEAKQAAAAGVKALKKGAAPAAQTAQSQLADLSQTGQQAVRSARHAVSDVHLPDVGALASHAGADLSDVAHKLTGRGAKKGQGMTAKASEATQKVGEQTTTLAQNAQAIAEQAASAAMAAASRAREKGSSLADTTRELLPQVPQTVQEKVTDEVVPAVRDIALHAASLALDLWQTARERAAEAAAAAEHELDSLEQQAAHVVESGAGAAKGAVAAGEGAAKDATSAVAGRVEDVGERAKEVSKHAAEATVETTKDTGATLFWAGAAAGLAFYALLSPERREQLTNAMKTVIAQTRELIQDLQGYDEEF